MFKNLNIPSRAELLAGISLASVMLGCGVQAHAQDVAAEQSSDAPVSEDGIVVTGVRASLSSAQSIKRNSDVIVDSIVAEDIGKLPDRNVAEALQRIPGIQVQRQYGEGSSVAIRGLTQVRTELNGRDIFTASGANQLSLEDIPSELLAGIDVYKNPSADLIEDQLSGTINFRTRKPFDFDGLKVAATATQSYFDLTDKFKPSASLMVSDRWDTGIGEIGILASVSFQKTSFRQDTISTEPFYTLDQSVDANGNPVSPVDYATAIQLGRLGQTTTLPHGTGIGEVYGDRRRLGTDVALQWRPSDTLELTAEVFRSDYKFRYDDYSFFAYSSDVSITPQPGAAFTYADNGDFQSGTFINVPVGNNTSAQTRHSTTTDYSLNLKWKPTDQLTVTADGQYVDAKTKNLRSIFGLNGTADTLYQDISGSIPVVNIGSATGLTNAATYTSAFYLDNLNESKASDKTARLDAEYRFDAGILSSIKAGFRYADRKNRTIDTGYRYTGLSGIPSELETVDLGDFFRGDADLFGNIIAFNRGIIRNYQNTLDTLGIASAPAYTQSGTNAQRQKTFTGYATAFFKADPVDGNIGVRVIRTNLDVSGYYQQTTIIQNPDGTETNGPTVFNPIAVSDDYTSVLPSLNLRVHLTDNLQLRFAAAKNISRPSFTQLAPSLTITEPGSAQQNQIHTASGGNPYLKPMKSDNLDATLEWYFSRTGSLTAAAFYKNIKNYIQTAVANREVTFDNGNTYTYEVTSYGNVAKGKVKGFELAYQQFFDFLPGPFDGLGMQANFTYVDSQAPSPATSGPVTNVPLELLSKYNYNIVGIYEKGGLSARVAYNWRSKYVVTTAGNGTGSLPIFNKPFGQLDASISYNVTPQFALALDGTNLTNTRRATYFGIDSRPRDVVVNDRRISLTARISY
ncbi:TonB-dependent receptor [Sphingobium scionense]|uniref:TonB-dependent receptor n=1 Tax=Sphingobium scionense TaxID=1404341 RepID=A0A7W6PSH4_9SPHN|nr:TonB-dependent receptor [Sphingobium scionense]MBB4146290.1 TonB-dependent receptor [Sphingobium scionense]